MNDKVIIYTDGGAKLNGKEHGCGGYGVVLIYKDHYKELYGGAVNTTNNRMELTAPIEALSTLKVSTKKYEIEIHLDSAYVMNCFTQKWYENWRKNGWKNSKKQPVENRELWERLIELYEIHGGEKCITFVKVKGHSGVEYNERCDQLATQGRLEIEALTEYSYD